MALEIDYDELNETLADLTGRLGVDDPDEELLTAANFAFRFGTFGDFAEEPQLTMLQMANVPPGAALGLLGHWSVQRNDPTGGREPGRSFEVHAEGCHICDFLEDTLTDRGVFEFETCEECGGDIDAHAIVILPIGKPGLMCVGQWTRVEPEVVNMGRVSHETQVSDSAWATSWWAPLADGQFAVVTRTYFTSNDHGRFVLVRTDDYIVCTDHDHPGDTETASQWGLSELDSDDPAFEDLHQLAVDSYPPDPGEWQQHCPESALFAVPVPA